MVRTLRRIAAVVVAVSTLCAPALADTGTFGAVVDSANLTIKSAAAQQSAQNTPVKPANDRVIVGQVPPVNQPPVSPEKAIGLPTGFDYTADLSVAYPLGDIGNGKRWLPGGFDAVAAYGFNSRQRLVLNYYELQHYPAGFNSGIKPVYLPGGFPLVPGVNPSCANLANSAAGGCNPVNIDVTTKDKFFLAYFNQLVLIGKGKRAIPLVISPTYVARTSRVAASLSGTDDIVPFVDNSGRPHTDIKTRTAQLKSIAFTLPFLKTPKMFGTFTAAPTWLMHTNGVNVQNHPQLYQILYLEYTMRPGTKFFFEPQSSRDYLPADEYAQHLMAYFLGASQRVGKMGFVQVVLNSGGPSNYGPYGVDKFQCFALPCSANTLPKVGALKATQIQLQFGIGSPSVLQF